MINSRLPVNPQKMEMFWEALCKFIVSKGRNITRYEYIGLDKFRIGIEDCSDKLNSTNKGFHNSEARIQKEYESMPYRGLRVFICLTALVIASSLSAFGFEDWWVGTMGLWVVLLLIYLYFKNKTIFTVPFKMKLRLMLWKIPPHDDDMMKPRCIFVPWNKHQAATWGEWLYAIILPKLRSELGITDMKGLDKIIRNEVVNLPKLPDELLSRTNDFLHYLLRNGVMGPLGDVPKLCFWLLGFVCFILLIIILIKNNPSKVISLVATISSLTTIIYNMMNKKHDVEANGKICDVICRLYRVMKKETIFFAVVANERDVLKEIPLEYRRYFKFVIICDEKISRSCLEKCSTMFNMNWLIYNEISDELDDLVADIISDSIIHKKLIPNSEDSENQLEFLRLLHEINNDNNKVFANMSMLLLVNGEVTLTYLKRIDSKLFDLELALTLPCGNFSASISDLDLQTFYSTQTKLIMKISQKKIYNLRYSNISSSKIILSFDRQPALYI